MKRLDFLGWLCILVTAATVAVSIWQIPLLLRPMNARTFLAEEEPAWQGVLEVWHINGWRTPQAGRSVILEAAARRVEKDNNGVFFEILNLTQEEYLSLLASGREPDILVFPGGTEGIQGEDMATLSLPEGLRQSFSQALCSQGARLWALPWIGSGTLLLVNPAAVVTSGSSPAWENGPYTADALVSLWKSWHYETGKKTRKQIVGLGTADLTALPLAGQTVSGFLSDTVLTDRQAWDAFLSGDTVSLLGSLWDAAALDRRLAEGKGFPYLRRAMPEDLPEELLLQWVAVSDRGDDGKKALAAAFAQALFHPAIQAKINLSTGCIPALELEPAVDSGAEAILKRLEKGVIVVLRPGVPLTQGDRLQAALGNTEALTRLRAAALYWNADE